jgi:hypothetical protein
VPSHAQSQQSFKNEPFFLEVTVVNAKSLASSLTSCQTTEEIDDDEVSAALSNEKHAVVK